MDNETNINQPGLIDIFKWFWREAPYLPGYKAVHAALFFAILDSINSNFWAENTPIAYDRLINKLRICKQVYLDSRTWLVENGLIEMTAGQNAYHMATFNIGLVVRNQTAILTGMLTTMQTADLTTIRTGMLTQVKTTIQKDKKIKRLKDNTPALPELNISFEIFYDLYDKKRGDTGKLKKAWVKLTDEERILAIEHIPKYKNSQPDKQFRKDPSTYLNNKSFNDEIIISNGHASSQNTQKGNFSKHAGVSIYSNEFSEGFAELAGN